MGYPILPEEEPWLLILNELRGYSDNQTAYMELAWKFSDQFLYPFVRFTDGVCKPQDDIMQPFWFEDPDKFEGDPWFEEGLRRFHTIMNFPLDDTSTPYTFGQLMPNQYSGQSGPYRTFADYHTVQPFFVNWRGVTHEVTQGLAGLALNIEPGDPSDPSLEQWVDIHVMCPRLQGNT